MIVSYRRRDSDGRLSHLAIGTLLHRAPTLAVVRMTGYRKVEILDSEQAATVKEWRKHGPR